MIRALASSAWTWLCPFCLGGEEDDGLGYGLANVRVVINQGRKAMCRCALCVRISCFRSQIAVASEGAGVRLLEILGRLLEEDVTLFRASLVILGHAESYLLTGDLDNLLF